MGPGMTLWGCPQENTPSWQGKVRLRTLSHGLTLWGPIHQVAQVKEQSSLSGHFPSAPLSVGPVSKGLGRHFGAGWEGSRATPASGSGLPNPGKWGGLGGIGTSVLPCSVSFIQGSDRCLSFEGLPEEAFEHLTNLNYLYLANNKVRGLQQGGGVLPQPPGIGG